MNVVIYEEAGTVEKVALAWANDEKNIVLCTYQEAGWSQEDSYLAMETQRAMIESSTAEVVDVIVDARAVRWLPVRHSFKKGLDTFVKLKHPRQGVTVFVVTWGIMASMAKLMISLIDRQKREFFFVATIDEALTQLAQVSASRQDEKIP